MSENPANERAVFSEIRQDYLAQLGAMWTDIDWAALDLNGNADGALITFFGQDLSVSPSTGFQDQEGREPSHAVCVALAKYLLINASGPAGGSEWVAYKQFPDAAAFVEGFSNTVERKVSQVFAGKGRDLARVAAGLGGFRPELELSYDLVLEFPALPRVPLLLLFNDEEEPFPAQCSVLLRSDAARYLDMECLAILGMVLAARLQAALDSADAGELLS